MQFGTHCVECMVIRQAAFARAHGDTATGLAFLKQVLQAIQDAPEGVSSPYMTAIFEHLAAEHYGLSGDLLAEEKAVSNRFMLARLESLRSRVFAAEDPLKMALRYARACNYIDFSALKGMVSYDELDSLLDAAGEAVLDETEYANFTRELSGQKKLVYLCDNAGEIVADRVVAEVLRQQYPQLQLTFAVRGKPASNDALMEDALAVGLDRFARVIDSGSNIPGTELPYIGDTLRQALTEADVILAKGMGNFETLWGCGMNVYYLFLCKCTRFQKMFGVENLTGMFVNERRLQLQDYVD